MADLTVTPGYLETLQIPLRAGRALRAADSTGATLIVVINEMMVRRYWDGDAARALGSRIRVGDERDPQTWRTVVGIVGNVRNDDLDAPPLPMVYVPLAQRPSRDMTLVLRTVDDPLVRVEGITGATDLGDGKVVLILDALRLARSGGAAARADMRRGVPEGR